MRSLDELLSARPTAQVWQEACLRLAELDEEGLAAVAPRVLSWPAQQRPMPDDWWAQWTAGDVRPYHSLAGTRRLGTLDEHQEASFPYGATAVAVPSGLAWLALGAAAEWHHNGGDIVGWNTGNGDVTWFLPGDRYHDEPHDMQTTPDGRTVVTSVEGRVLAWSAETGDRLWTYPEGARLSEEEDEDGAAEDAEDEDEDDAQECEDEEDVQGDGPVRIGFSADGRRVAIGTYAPGPVMVVETATGRVLLTLPSGHDASGPVALDANGRLLAHAATKGRVTVRAVEDGAVLTEARTGLAEVNALAFAPDATALFAVGAAADDATPAARLLTLDPAPTAGDLVRPVESPGGIDAASPLARCSTRAVWTDHGPYAFVAADDGTVLFDSEGRTLWADPRHPIVSFTPDGRAMVTVGETIDAWFLTGLSPGTRKA